MNNLTKYNAIKKDLTSKKKFQIKLGLERILQILDIVDNPQQKLKIIHVAGTNGKGSTCSMLAQILTNSGYKTGLYTSPHLLKYNERIKIDGLDISDEDFNNLLSKVNNISDAHQISLTEFETLTVIAFLYFEEKNIDIAVLETGLGGRFDATNVIKPICSAITSISLDHIDRLGNTIEKIAYEKAGIIKPQTPVIISHCNKNINCIKDIAVKNNSELILSMPFSNVEYKNYKNYIEIGQKTYETNLIGDFQGENLSLVLSVLKLLKKYGYLIKNEKTTLKNINWHARMQFLEKNVILDGAHNPSAIRFLRDFLDRYFNTMPKTFFFGALNTKDYQQNLKTLLSKEDKAYFIEFDYKNSCKKENYERYLTSENRKMLDIKDFWKIYQKEKQENLIIITGSLYLSGAIFSKFLSNNQSVG